MSDVLQPQCCPTSCDVLPLEIQVHQRSILVCIIVVADHEALSANRGNMDSLTSMPSAPSTICCCIVLQWAHVMNKMLLPDCRSCLQTPQSTGN